ncbi:ATP-dependent RecD-like DNA helicase [Scytonema sp. UIC 10036]|uniref:SF1B family DNA helicase RecD2 n=1 Tax=Scytonema sp. UIC 10036 TaxID=2304196 RepID=UPI0012DA82D2|nr:ATP-dependent RecD-like DNA helicase [Scytonema sp. UIC 10036]MUG91878.1 ATP-dependent RecD-like DNA helicase [Scytonema sp. UIC 10036]
MTTFSQVNQLPILTEVEIRQYLSSGIFRGIGKKTALSLVEQFGCQTLLVLDREPEKLHEVPGLTNYRIQNIIQAWSESKSDPNLRVAAKLLGVGATLNLTLKICDHYGHKTESVLRDNPYRLIDDVDGIGFKTADELALLLGTPETSEKRYEKGIIQALKDALLEGHCFLPEYQIIKKAIFLLKRPTHEPEAESLKRVLNGLIENQVLVQGSIPNSIYLKAAYRAEVSVAFRIKALLNQKNNSTEHLEQWLTEYHNVAYRELSRLSHEQINALYMAERSPISILTGGPGRGKTHVLKTLVDWLLFKKASFALVAPTGKAANRMQTATDTDAQTIHRLLQWRGKEQSFLYNEQNPLNLDWLIVDEFSMVDLFLFNSLLKALPLTTKILLVGDSDQLPSVGAGMVLRDLINSELIPTTRLETIFRQKHESSIIYAASDVNLGNVPALHNFTCVSQWMDVGDCAILTTESAQETAKTIVELVKAMAAENVNLKEQVMVLAPQKEGAAGVYNLNKLLQPIFNPQKSNQPEVVVGSVTYRVGDRIIQLKNRYDTSPAVMNGESGEVIGIDPEKKIVKVAFDGGAIVDYSTGKFEEIMHAFTITCHKSQGSEFQYVIFPLLKSNYLMLTRQLLYTTMTRAQGTFIAVGQEEALKIAVTTDRPARRLTGLIHFLISPFEELNQTFSEIKNSKTTANPANLITIASRLQELGLEATQGQMTSIGTLVLKLYEDRYGHRPCKQLEQVGKFQFKTYHYELHALDLINSAIDLVFNK